MGERAERATNDARKITLGAIISILSGYGLYWTIMQMWTGLAAKDVWMLASGGVVFLIFGGILVGGVVVGVALIALGMDWL